MTTEQQTNLKFLFCLEKSLVNLTCRNYYSTGDETWVFEYHPETKCQSFHWKSPQSQRIKKARQLRSKIKLILILFFDVRGMDHYEFLPQGEAVNQHINKKILQRLLGSVRKKKARFVGKQHTVASPR